MSNSVKSEIRAFYYDEIADSLSSGDVSTGCIVVLERLSGVLEGRFGDFDAEEDEEKPSRMMMMSLTRQHNNRNNVRKKTSTETSSIWHEDASVCVNIFLCVKVMLTDENL